MMLLVITLATLALSNANPMVTSLRHLSTRQTSPSCGNVTVPEHCIRAQVDYQHASVEILTNFTSDSGARLTSAIATFLGFYCSDDCLRPFLAVDACENNGSAAFATNNLDCAQHEDGTYCPAKVYGELVRNSSIPVPSCVSAASPNCSATCRQAYLDTRSRLGCCAASYYGNNETSPFYSFFGRNFEICDVTLGDPCPSASGAATICLNFLLMIAVIMLSVMAIIWVPVHPLASISTSWACVKIFKFSFYKNNVLYFVLFANYYRCWVI